MDAFIKLLQTCFQTKLPKMLLDDMGALLIYEQLATTDNSTLQLAVHRLSQKKEQSSLLALIKRKKIGPFDEMLSSMTGKLRDLQVRESKMEAARELRKSMGAMVDKLPTQDKDGRHQKFLP